MKHLGVLVLALSAGLSGPSMANEPEILDRWGTPGKFPGQLEDLRGISVDADGNVFVIDRNRLQKFTNDGIFVYRITKGAAASFDGPQSLVVDGNGDIYVLDSGNNMVHTFSNDGEILNSWGMSAFGLWGNNLAVDSENNIYVRAYGMVRRFTKNGEPINGFTVPGQWGLAVDEEGNAYVEDRDKIYKYSSNGDLLGTLGDERTPLGSVKGMAVDARGFVHIADTGPQIKVVDSDGNHRRPWGDQQNATGIAIDIDGNIYVADAGTHQITKYAAPSSFLPTDPPAVLLHVQEPSGRKNPCSAAPKSVSEVVTSGEARPDGSALYYVYLLASPGGEDDDLAGVQLGIEYDESHGADVSLKVFSWHSCSDLQFPDDEWPVSGSGNTITWAECQEDPLVVAGYFYVSAYAPAIMSIVGFPRHTHVVKTANCAAAEAIPDLPLGMDRVGWVSLGGATRGFDADGCNPLLEPCDQGPTPIRSTTWGQLKSRYQTPGKR